MKYYFSSLVVGDTFDFVDPTEPHVAAFFEPCEKISFRKYRAMSNNAVFEIDSPKRQVFHVRSRDQF